MQLRDEPLPSEERAMNFHFSPANSFVTSIHRFNSLPAQQNASRQPTPAQGPSPVFNADNTAKKTRYRSGMDNLNRNSPL